MANIKFAYKVFEPKEGCDSSLSPVIFHHGLIMAKEMWEDIPQVIADKTKRKTYAYDARHHGDTDYTGGFNFDLLADDVFRFMDTHGIEKAILIGHSMGGIVATTAALKNPDRIEMVFSEDMPIHKVPAEKAAPSVTAILLRKESFENSPKGLSEEEILDFSAEYMITKLPPGSPLCMMKEMFRKMKVFMRRKPDGGYELKFNADVIAEGLKDTDALSHDPVGEYDGPAYFLYANKSPLEVKSHEENIKKHFPKAELIEFDTASHYIHEECTDEFINTLLSRLLK